MMNDYITPVNEITPYTLAVLAHQDKSGNIITCVLEEETEYVVDVTPSRMVDHACKFFGSSLRGRQDGTRDICGITHKAPISIDPVSGMYFFPTSSPTNPDCSWIAHSHIDEVKRAMNQGTEIVFKNGKHIIIPTSFGSMMNQIQRTAQFRYLLDNRIRYLQRQKVAQKSKPYA
ncbi:competence protein ComK [Ornithinibacillus halophilus]|uniref:Competence protein ComK n=1 Tax=Ornithinibacillus halophilus TaxID=930117 RepID=A0A1M5MBV7_9BACI|nr:competence protein ComK [Ornithinibacillus halophilus]SHG74213.1 competence protein ComK [Ornithinibacillus halophilus]